MATSSTKVEQLHDPSPQADPPVLLADRVSITGVKQIFGPKEFLLRRLLWSILLMGSMGFLGYQIHKQFSSYKDSPTIQTSSDIYVKQMTFPSVTFCNNNYFRLSTTMNYLTRDDLSEKRQVTNFEIVTKFMKILRKTVINDTEIEKEILSLGPEGELNVELFYKQTSHLKKNMFKRCVFNGHECDDSWFDSVLTDAGYCYRFNGNQTLPLRTALSGREGGLHVELNIEQYEYMIGQRDSAGVYLLIQDQSEIPNLIYNNGLQVGPGGQTSIALRTTERRSEVENEGVCGTTGFTEFPSHQSYSRSACDLDCLTRLVKEKCGCVHFYMPTRETNTSQVRCRLKYIISCIYVYSDVFPTLDNYTNVCGCKTPCQIKTFQPSVSQTTFSLDAVTRFAREKIFGHDVFKEYKHSMLFRDWTTVLLADFNLADDLHSLVYRLNVTMLKINQAIQNLQTTLKDSQMSNSCLSATSILNLDQIGVNLTLLSIDGLDSVYVNTYYTPTIRLSTRLAHALLTASSFAQTIAGELFAKSATIETILTKTVHDLDLDCSSILSQCSQINNLLCSLTDIGCSQPEDQLCAFKEFLVDYESMFNNISQSQIELETDYKDLQERVIEAVKTYYTPWKEDNLDLPFYRDNYAVVDVFFQDMVVTKITERSAYDVVDLLCDIGGCLGLCLGGSLLTVFEIIDYFFSKTFISNPRISPNH